jgi:two-component sensor histidine kinase
MLSSVPNEYDRSRYLLVSLILANMGNLEIDVVEKGTDSEERMDEAMDVNTPEIQRPSTSTDQIRLKLLKLERHHRVSHNLQISHSV